MSRATEIQELHKWAQDSDVLRLGDENKSVAILQRHLKLVHPDLYIGPVDSNFGKGTQSGVMRFQQYRLLEEDGVVGRRTKGELLTCIMSAWHPGIEFDFRGIKVYGPWHPYLGWLPDVELGSAERGRISGFGGPYDPGDRTWGQAYIRDAPSPRKLLEARSELVKMGILMTAEQMLRVKQAVCPTCGHMWYPRSEDNSCRYGPDSHGTPIVTPVLKSMDEWPMVSDWSCSKKTCRCKDRKLKRAGTSWALNEEDGYWIAMRFKRSLSKYWNENNPRLLVWSERTKKYVVVLRTDFGPAKWTGKLVDLSPRTLKDLGLKTGDKVFVTYAADHSHLGSVII